MCQTFSKWYFNPLFPYGKRPVFMVRGFGFCKFQSTLPIREETRCPGTISGGTINFNPLFPYGKRLHANAQEPSHRGFQSTLPIREETIVNLSVRVGKVISIHSSHTGRDSPSSSASAQHTKIISIHSSHTGRDVTVTKRSPAARLFQSTLPIREETANAYNLSARKVVASAQHRLIFDSSLLFPAVQNWFWG